MAIIPLFRVVIFTLITLFSLVVLGICAHIEYLVAGRMDFYLSFAAFGLGGGCLTVVSIPLLWALGNLRHRVFTSMILFETIWFFILWVVWVGTAGDTVAGKAYLFPAGCVYDDYPTANQICYEFTVEEAFAFLNFFCAFIYYDVIFLYAIINAIRGKGIWTISVKEATTDTPDAPMAQPQFIVTPATEYQHYGAYPQALPQGVPAQPYNAYPQQVPQDLPQQYNAYPQQASLYGSPTIPLGPNQPYSYLPPGAAQQHVNYGGYPSSPTTSESPLPPQSIYNPHPVSSSQTLLPLPSGYQGQSIPQQRPQSLYGLHQPIPV